MRIKNYVAKEKRCLGVVFLRKVHIVEIECHHLLHIHQSFSVRYGLPTYPPFLLELLFHWVLSGGFHLFSRTWSIGVVFPLSTFRTIRTCYHQSICWVSNCFKDLNACSLCMPTIRCCPSLLSSTPSCSNHCFRKMVEAIDLPKSLFHRSII